MRFSIIIPVYNRLDEVKELLPSLEAQTFDLSRVELVLIDDGSSDGFKEYIQRYTADFSITTHFQSNKGPAVARNVGMSLAKGEYMLFTDSDCILPPEWLSLIDQAITQHGYQFFGGPDTCHPSFSDLIKAINYSLTSKVGTGGTRGNKTSVTKFYPRTFNMGISQEIYQKVGGMKDIRYGEDTDFSYRIYDAGYTAGLISEAYVYHKRRVNLRSFYRQINNWGWARVVLSKDRPEMLKPIHLAPAFLLAFALCCVFILVIFPHIWVQRLMLAGLVGLGLITLYVWVEAWAKNKSLKVATLAVMTTFIQVLAYGMGIYRAYYHRMFNPKAIDRIQKPR